MAEALQDEPHAQVAWSLSSLVEGRASGDEVGPRDVCGERVGGKKVKLSFSMPKAKGKGGKNRRRGKNDADDKRELVFKDESQEYAQVVKMLGNGRLEALCFDGEKRLAHIRGKLRKKVWINNGDIILLSLREFEDGKADVIQKYSPDEARALKQYGELPETTKISEETLGDDEAGDVEFQEVSDEEDEDLDDL